MECSLFFFYSYTCATQGLDTFTFITLLFVSAQCLKMWHVSLTPRAKVTKKDLLRPTQPEAMSLMWKHVKHHCVSTASSCSCIHHPLCLVLAHMRGEERGGTSGTQPVAHSKECEGFIQLACISFVPLFRSSWMIWAACWGEALSVSGASSLHQYLCIN